MISKIDDLSTLFGDVMNAMNIKEEIDKEKPLSERRAQDVSNDSPKEGVTKSGKQGKRSSKQTDSMNKSSAAQ